MTTPPLEPAPTDPPDGETQDMPTETESGNSTTSQVLDDEKCVDDRDDAGLTVTARACSSSGGGNDASGVALAPSMLRAQTLTKAKKPGKAVLLRTAVLLAGLAFGRDTARPRGSDGVALAEAAAASSNAEASTRRQRRSAGGHADGEGTYEVDQYRRYDPRDIRGGDQPAGVVGGGGRFSVEDEEKGEMDDSFMVEEDDYAGKDEVTEEDDVIVVATVGGTLAGLSRSTGQTLWKHNGNAVGPDRDHDATNMRTPGRGPHGVKNDNEYGAGRLGDGGRLLSPLVSTTTTTASGHDWRTAAVPSVDGRVYLTAGRDNSGASGGASNGGPTSSSSSPDSPSDVTATTTVQDLVSRAPFVDARGRFYVGSRHATVAALDRDTGEILRVVPTGKTTNTNNEDDVAGESEAPSLEGRKVVWVGRVDYSISVHDVRSGEVDVEFSTAEILSVEDMVRGDHQPEVDLSSLPPELSLDYVGGDGTSHLHNPMLALPSGEGYAAETVGMSSRGGSSTVSSSSSSPFEATSFSASSQLISTPNGNVALRDPGTGLIEWVSNDTFETPVAFAVESTSGESVGVDIVPDAPVPDSSKDYLSRELERQIAAMDRRDAHVMSSRDGKGMVPDASSRIRESIVGALGSGQLFALPLGRRGGRQAASSSGQRRYFPPGLPSPLISSTKQLSQFPHVVGRQQHSEDLDSGSNFHTHVSAGSRKNCLPSSPSYPGCLVGLSIPQGGAPNGQGSFLDPPTYGEFTDSLSPDYDLYPDYYGGDTGKRAGNFRTFLRIMSSWVPPAVALMFVVSFELGRRERIKAESRIKQKKKKARKGASPSKDELSDDPNLTLVEKDSVSDSGSRNVGVIQVLDEVLGYGGHGTVVYKGMLDGRRVAVKRMLKTYHASADREISLLIESDGHPNVVRYFLKEMRGDFVYLALELCDMSLNDLIVALSKRKLMLGKDSSSGISSIDTGAHEVESATKKTLFQVASGVRHIHSLRIVHRDLKPQNILLAHRCRNKNNEQEISHQSESDSDTELEVEEADSSDEESMFAHFEGGDYVPKISDMGLGKQLAGQSSFGLSTLGNASAGGGAGASVVGVGPGSVGWQAPEVMAMRWSPEASSQCMPADSSGGTESMVEASPIDIAMSTRTSRSVDIFSLGCIFYCTILPGSHPFGEWYEREANIMKNKPSIEELDFVSPDAFDLVRSMIDRDPKARPTAAQVCDHPFFWSASKRLAFLCDLSDRLEAMEATGEENPPRSQSIDLFSLEKNAAVVIGVAWDKHLDPDLFSNVTRFRTYDPSSVRDFLRLIRNKHHHYDELSKEVKEKIGSNPDGLNSYFETRFPRLLMHCYNVCRVSLSEDDLLSLKYAIPRSLRARKTLEPSHPGLLLISPREEKNMGARVDDRTAPAQNVVKNTESKEGGNNDDYVLVGSKGCANGEETRSNTVSISSLASTPPSCVTDTPEPSTPSGLDSPVESTSSPVAESSTAFATAPVFPQLHSGTVKDNKDAHGIVVWEGSNAAKTFQCRGWMRSEDEWVRRTDVTLMKRDANITRCVDDPKFRTRLCNHWDASCGTYCPMRKKNKCVFAHGPIELRVKEGKKHRWGTLVDKNGDNSNPWHSGGEDTYGAARTIETTRKEEGKWNTQKAPQGKARYKRKPSQGSPKRR